MDFDIGNNNTREYELEAIKHSVVYTRELELSYLLGLSYLVFWKDYTEEKNT